MTLRIYRNVSPPPMLRGPYGYSQYSVIVSAGTKAEAAGLVGIDPSEMQWDRDLSWDTLHAVLDAGMLTTPGEVYATGCTGPGVDPFAVHRRSGDGWEYVGRVEYRRGDFSRPYLNTESEG